MQLDMDQTEARTFLAFRAQGYGRIRIGKEMNRSSYTVKHWIHHQSEGRFTERDGIVSFDGEPIPLMQAIETEQTVFDQYPIEEVIAPCYVHMEDPPRYVFTLRSHRKVVVIRDPVIQQIVSGYSNADGAPKTINQLACDLGWPRVTVREVLAALQKTHDCIPFTDEELGNVPEEELVQDLIRRKEGRVVVRAEQERWKKVQANSDKWESLEKSVLHVVNENMSEWFQTYSVMPFDFGDPKFHHALVIAATDLHYGLYSDSKETGFAYNRDIARERLHKHTEELLTDLSGLGRPDMTYSGIGSDWFHIDCDGGTTTRGTPMDTDGTYSDIFVGGCQLAVEHIDMLRHVGPVTVIGFPGNHDRTGSLSLASYLQAWYRDCKDVTVNVSARQRQYERYGNTLMGFTHGDDVKLTELPNLMASEARRDWGDTENHLWFTGHLHHEKTAAVAGSTVVQLTALASPDRWHARKGYVMSRNALEAFVLHHERGLKAQWFAPVEDLR